VKSCIDASVRAYSDKIPEGETSTYILHLSDTLLTHLIDPGICLEANGKADRKEEAGVPVDENEDV
jgi:hypothetical protein